MESELETVYLQVPDGGSPQYVPVEAVRTSENYFRIATEPSNEQIGAFKTGDVVRCAWRYFGPGFEGGIVAISHATKTLPEFSVGDKVKVSEHAGWRTSFLGTVASGPEPEVTRLGESARYWVEFEERQKDRGEQDEYIKAQVSNVYLALA